MKKPCSKIWIFFFHSCTRHYKTKKHLHSAHRYLFFMAACVYGLPRNRSVVPALKYGCFVRLRQARPQFHSFTFSHLHSMWKPFAWIVWYSGDRQELCWVRAYYHHLEIKCSFGLPAHQQHPSQYKTNHSLRVTNHLKIRRIHLVFTFPHSLSLTISILFGIFSFVP